ncbi:MAG: hypothetical protein KTR32_39475 [Granulosicoccus sp.]|nr:hypothetical protein [Granulosicoccus sp.]
MTNTRQHNKSGTYPLYHFTRLGFNPIKHSTLYWFVFALAVLNSNTTTANTCPTSTPFMQSAGQTPSTEDGAENWFQHEFASGARWQLCWRVHPVTGLGVSQVSYAAPGESMRQVLDKATLAQVLIKYDDESQDNAVLPIPGLGGDNAITANSLLCQSGNVLTSTTGQHICQSVRDKNSLTTTRRTASLRRHELTLSARSEVDTLLIDQRWHFSEDGQISPEIQLSGELSRFTRASEYGSPVGLSQVLATNASLLYTWRLDFNINGTAENDLIESIEFVPFETDVVRRTINRSEIETESLHNVNAEQFRGWLISDADVSAGNSGHTNIAYFLDPQTSGYRFVSRTKNWATFDLAVTKRKECEQYPSQNNLVTSNASDTCGNSLDDFVNGESLINEDSVIWFSLSRQLLPKKEDLPVLQPRRAHFVLTPFDWSAHSRFSEAPE